MTLAALFENVPFAFSETRLNARQELETLYEKIVADVVNGIMKTRSFHNNIVVAECSLPAS